MVIAVIIQKISVVIDFRRQILTSKDGPRAERVNSLTAESSNMAPDNPMFF